MILSQERTAILRSGGHDRGLAFLLGSNLYVTTKYLAEDTDQPFELRPLSSDNFVSCEVIWKSTLNANEHFPLALLRIPDQGSPGLDPITIGRLGGDQVRDASFVGFSYGDAFGSFYIRGTVDPATLLQTPGLAVYPRSPLVVTTEGLGGAGVLVEDKLVGVIYSSYSTREGGEALFAASMVDALADPELKKTLQRELGRLPAVVDIITPEVDFGSALVDVSRADPANIQEVAGSQLKLTNLYYENVLSQAKRSFNAAVVAGSVGLLFFLVAIGFSLGSSQLTAPLISATGGGLVEAVAGLNFWLYSSTAEQLNSFHLRLDRMQRYLVANSISQGLGEIQRDVVISGLVKAISTSEWLDGDAPVV